MYMHNQDQKLVIEVDPKSKRPLWTKQDVADKYQVGYRTVDWWMATGKIPYAKIGRLVRFFPDDVEKALIK
jgi:excisionase family DNA binding protein